MSKLAVKKTAIVRRKAKRHTAIVRREPPSLAEAVEKVLIGGDLTPLNVEQRLDYYKKVCTSLGLNPLTRPFDYIAYQGKLTLYARRDCTDQLRKIHGVSVTSMKKEVSEGMYMVEVEVKDKLGRTDTGTGVVFTTGLKGTELANAYMKAETKAKRRATLSVCGLGFLDQSELDGIADYNEITSGGRIITENGKKREPAEITEAQLRKHESIQLVEWKEGLYAITGNGLGIIRSELTEEEKKKFDIKYQGADKVFTIPMAQGFDFKDMCERKKVEVTFTEKA